MEIQKLLLVKRIKLKGKFFTVVCGNVSRFSIIINFGTQLGINQKN